MRYRCTFSTLSHNVLRNRAQHLSSLAIHYKVISIDMNSAYILLFLLDFYTKAAVLISQIAYYSF